MVEGTPMVQLVRVVGLVVLAAVIVVVMPGSVLAADPVTARDIQECPNLSGPFDSVQLSEDPVIAAEQELLADLRYSHYDAATAWALRFDPIRQSLVTRPDLTGLEFTIDNRLSQYPEVDALVADRGLIAVDYQLVTVSEADASAVRGVLEGYTGVEVVVDPNRREVVDAWAQLYRRLENWRNGEQAEGPSPYGKGSRVLPAVDSPSWAVVELTDEELDRDVSWLLDGLDLSVVCRVTSTVLPDEPSGAGWRLIAQSSSAHNVINDPSQVDWTGGKPVDFGTEFVIPVSLRGRLAGADATFDGLDFATDIGTGPGGERLIAISRSLVPAEGLVIRIDREIHEVYSNADGIIELGGAGAEPPPHDAALVAGVDIATRPGGGVWRIDLGGALYATEGAPYLGSMGGIEIDEPMVALAPTPTGDGYWMAARDGGIFAFGDAAFHGSVPGVLPPGVSLAQPIVDIEPTPTGDGYWLLGADGGVFTFGDAPYLGSIPSLTADLGLDRILAENDRAVGIASIGDGYAIATEQGQLFNFGFALTLVGLAVDPAPVTGITNDLVFERGTRVSVGVGAVQPPSHMLRCPAGTARTTRPVRNTAQSRFSPYPDLASALRAVPETAGGHWVNFELIATDVVNGRQVRFEAGTSPSPHPLRIPPASGWYAAEITVCEP
ncbi:MAG: hypothetical protein R2770_08775 [Acidimicrobiales bacterium]